MTIRRAGGVALLLVALVGCVPHISQRKLDLVPNGERVAVAAPLKVIEDRGLSKIEWVLMPGAYVERYSAEIGRIYLSEGNIVQATTPFGSKTSHPGGWIVLKDRPGFAKLFIVRGKSGQMMMQDLPGGQGLYLDLAAGVEGDLTLITDIRLADIKRR